MFIYPWGDFHSLNLGWFLVQFKAWTEKIQDYLDNGGGTAENLANVIAPVFNAENSYLTGDYVLYNDELYKANRAVNPGTWNPDAWTRCLVTEEMGSGSGGVDSVARLMIAGQYSNTYNYQKYAICRYNDKLWMCNTNLPAGGEEWEQSHWDEITVGAGLTGLRRSVETLAQAISDETAAREETDSELVTSLNSVEEGLAIIVTGDTCTTPVPAGGYAYIKNNTHGLTEGLYRNKTSSAFPTSGGTANSTVFEAVSNGGLNEFKVHSILQISKTYTGITGNADTNIPLSSNILEDLSIPSTANICGYQLMNDSGFNGAVIASYRNGNSFYIKSNKALSNATLNVYWYIWN